jgi:hypothetical protein
LAKKDWVKVIKNGNPLIIEIDSDRYASREEAIFSTQGDEFEVRCNGRVLSTSGRKTTFNIDEVFKKRITRKLQLGLLLSE